MQVSYGMDDGKKSSFERRNPRGDVQDTHSDDSGDSDSGDEEAGFADHSGIDVTFENELGYGLIVGLRGRTTGRRVKREICCFATFQIIVGGSLYLIGYFESRSKFIMDFLIESDSSALSWTRAISIMCLLWAAVNILILRYWSSVVTNRVLMSTILKLMVTVFFVKFILVLVAVVTIINTFKVYRYGAGATPDVNSMFPMYFCSVIFLFAYLICTCMYGMNVSYLNEEVELGGNIREPNPVGVMDLTGVTFQECCTAILAYPVAIIYQGAELVYAMYLMGSRGWYFFWRRFEEQRQASAASRAAAQAERAKKGRSFYRRLTKTMKRLLSYVPGFRPKKDPYVQPLPVAMENVKAADREQQQRLEAERMKEEAERRSRFEEARRAKEALDAADRMKLEEEAAEAAKRLKELQEEEERLKANEFKPTLNSEKFKVSWGDLAQAGSFQCKLKTMPDVKSFTNHLAKQGFHVVFAAGPGANGEIEVGLCNIRASNDDKWFLARLMAAKGAFSAIMKAESPDIVPKFVKKFALAKILKIDTSKK